MGASQSGELQLAVMANILCARLIPPTDRAFWDKLLSLATTPGEVFDNFSLDILRAIRDRQPANFASLVKLACMELHSVVWRHKQTRAMVTAASLHSTHSTQIDPVTSATTAFITEHKPLLLNCLRILSRCLAVLAEEPTHPMRAFITGGVLYGMMEKHEEDKRRKEEAQARKAKEKADAEEMARRARAIQAERDKEEAVRREEQRQADRLRIEAEAKKAVEAADAAQSKAKETKETNPSGPPSSPPANASPPHAQPFGSGSGVGTPANASHEEFADEEQPVSDPTTEVAIARVMTEDGQVQEVEVPLNSEEEQLQAQEEARHAALNVAHALPATPSAVDEATPSTVEDTAESNFAFISAAAANSEAAAPPATAQPAPPDTVQLKEETVEAGGPVTDTPVAPAAELAPASAPAPTPVPPPASTPPSTAAPAPTAAAAPPAKGGKVVKTKGEAGLDEWWTGQLYGSPLSSLIISLLLDLSFLPSFTLSPTPTPFVVRHDLHLGRCWAPGAGYPPKLASTSYGASLQYVGEEWELDSNRVEVLRCVLTAVASSMFSPALVLDDPFMRALVTQPHEMTTTFAFSLLNVLLGYRAEAILPYAYAISTDYRAPLVELSSHLLLILLDFPGGAADGEGEAGKKALKEGGKKAKGKANGHSSAEAGSSEAQSQEEKQSPAPSAPRRPAAVTIPEDGSISASAVMTQRHAEPQLQAQAEQQRALAHPAPHSNAFVDRLFSLVPQDLTYVYTSICRLLHYGMGANATYLPGSSSGITIEAELIVLLWKWMDRDPNFLPHILNPEHCDILHLLTPLLHYVYDARLEHSKLGLMYSCVFVLLKLSGEREFSVELNRPIGSVPSLAHIPLLTILGFPDLREGTYGDALIIIAHQLIVSSPNHLDSLLKVLLTMLTNISPYLTRLSALASIRLMALFELFTEPSFLYANATNHQYALLLLELFNNAVQYQFAGSGQLILAIVRRARAFYALRVTTPGESYMSPMQGVGSKGHSVVFHLHRPTAPDSPLLPAQTVAAPRTPSSASLSEVSTPQWVASVGDNGASIASTNSHTSDASPSTASASHTAPSPSTTSSAAEAGHAGTPAAEWKVRLPLECLYRLFDFLLPRVEAMARATPNLSDSAVLQFIQSQTLVGILPIPHPIVVRRYVRNQFTSDWFSRYIMGLVYLKSQHSAHKLFDGSKVKLFALSGRGGKGEGGEEAKTSVAAKTG